MSMDEKGDMKDYADYKDTTLTYILANVLTRIEKWLREKLESLEFLQHGFRKGESTPTIQR